MIDLRDTSNETKHVLHMRKYVPINVFPVEVLEQSDLRNLWQPH